MLALFAFLVWDRDTWIAAAPKMAGAPSGARFPLTAFLITWVIGASALLILAMVPRSLSSYSILSIAITNRSAPDLRIFLGYRARFFYTSSCPSQ